MEALFVEGEQVDFFGGVEVGLGPGEGLVGERIVSEFAGVSFDAQGEDIVFDGFDAVEAPVVVGDAVGELDFEEAFGVEFGEEGGVVLVVGIAVFFGQEGGLAGETVAEAVEAGPGFAGRGGGAGGVGGVFAVGEDLGG